MKILITGGAGFIGSHLCDQLTSAGHEIFCIDNFVTGSRDNIKQFQDNHQFHLIEHDIVKPLKLDLESLDQIYHLASPASPLDYRNIPLETLWTNGAGTKNILDIAAKYSAKILFASTSEVYGDPLENPQKETYFGNVNPIGERSCYNEGKRFAESLCIHYFNKFRFPLRIVRIFNVYGPRMRKDDGRVIPEFINQALKGKPLLVTGDGSQTRSFCYIDDLLDGLIKIMNLDDTVIAPINLGNPNEITILNLAKKIIKLTDSKSEISYNEKPENDPRQRCPDVSLVREKIQFNPKIRLEDGLKQLIMTFK
jgi:nucleoside-diphosphate-sugar epimerase